MALYNEILNLFSKKKKKKNEEGGARNSTASFSDKKQKENKSASAPMTFQQSITTGKNTVSSAITNEANKRKSTSLADIGTGAGAKNGIRKGWEGKDSSDIAKSVVKYGEVVREQREKRKDLYQKTLKETGSINAARKAVDDAEGYVNTRSEGYNKLHNLAHGMGETTAYGVSGAVDSAANIVGAGANAAQAVYNIPYDIMRRNKANIETMLRKDKLDVPEGMDEASYRAILENQLNRIDDEMNTYNTNGIVGSNAVNDVQNAISGYANDIRQANSDDGGAFVSHARNVAQNAGNNIANMAAGAALSAVTGGAVAPSIAGKIALGVGAYGNAADIALQQTGDEQAARNAADAAGNSAIDNAKLQAIYDAVLARTGDKNIALQYAQKAAEEMYNDAAASAYAQVLRQTGDPLYANARGITGAANEEIQELISPTNTAFNNVASSTADLLNEGLQEAVGTYMEQLEEPLAYAILGGDEYSGKAKESAKEAVNNIAGKNALNTFKEAGKAFGGGVESSLLLGGLTNPTGLAEGISEDAKMVYSVRHNKVGLDETNKTISAIESATAGRKLTDAEQSALNDEYAKKADFERFFANPYFTQSSSKSMRRTGQQAAEELTNISAKLSNAKISDTTLNNIKSLSKATKTAVEFKDDLYDADGNEVNGLYKDGIIQINSNLSTDQAVNTVLAHEMAHSLETSENYNAYKNALNDLIENGDVDIGYDSISDLQNAIRQTYGDQIKEDQLDNETVAFITEKLIGNETALTELAQNNSSLAGRLSSWIDNTAEQISGDRAQSQLAKVRKLLNRAINTTSRKDVGEQYKERTPEEKAKIANEKLNLLRRSGPYMFSNDKKKAEEVVTDLARRYGEGELTEEQVSDELNKQLGDLTLADSDESTNKTQAVKEKTGKKQSKSKSAKEKKAGEAKVEESTADAVTRMNAEKQEQAAKNAKKSHEFFQNLKEADAAKAKAQQEKVETEKQRGKRLAKEERDKARAERQAAKDAEAKAKAEKTASKKNYSNLGNDKFSGVPVTLRNDFKWSAQKFIKTRTSTISSALPEGTSEETKTAIFNNVKYKALTDYQQESFNALKNNTDVSEEAKNKAVNDVVKILKDNGVEKLNEVKGKSFDNLEDAVRNILFPPRGGARKAKAATKTDADIYAEVMAKPEQVKAKAKATVKPTKAQAVEEKRVAEPKETVHTDTKTPTKATIPTQAVKEKTGKKQSKVTPAVAESGKKVNQDQAIFDKTVNNIEKKNPYKVKVTPENRQAIIDKVEKYKADFVQRLVDLGAERDVSERLAQKIAETGKWKANSADVSIENDNDRATAWHQIEKANPNYKTEDIKKWFADAMKRIPSEYRNIGLYDNPTYWVNKRTKVDDTKPASAQAKLLTDAGISGELANETVNAILNKTGGKDGNKATWAKGTYNDLMAAVANKEGLNLKDDADKAKARGILGSLKSKIKEQLAENGWKTSKIVKQDVQKVSKTENKENTKAEEKPKYEVSVVGDNDFTKLIATEEGRRRMNAYSKAADVASTVKQATNVAEAIQYGGGVVKAIADASKTVAPEDVPILKDAIIAMTSTTAGQRKLIEDWEKREESNSKATPIDAIPPNMRYRTSEGDSIKDLDAKDITVSRTYQQAANGLKTNKTTAAQIRNVLESDTNPTGKSKTMHFADVKADAKSVIKNFGFDYDTVIRLASSDDASVLDDYLEKQFKDKKVTGGLSYDYKSKVKTQVILECKRYADAEFNEIQSEAEKDGFTVSMKNYVTSKDMAGEYAIIRDKNGKVVKKGDDAKADQYREQFKQNSIRTQNIIRQMGTISGDAARTMALFSEYARKDPAGAWDMVMKDIDALQVSVDAKDKHRGKYGTVDLRQAIQDAGLDKEWRDAATELDRGKVYPKIVKTLADNIPMSRVEKMDNIRMFAMLANPLTHLRNCFANVLMQGAYSLDNINKAALEGALAKGGRVQDHKLLFYDNGLIHPIIPANNAENRRLLQHTSATSLATLTEMLSDYKSGNTGIATGELAKTFKRFKGKNFTFGADSGMASRTVNEIAYQLRNEGYTLDDSDNIVDYQGDEIPSKELYRIVNNSYNIAHKQLFTQADIQSWNQYDIDYSEYAKEQKQNLIQYYDKNLKDDVSQSTQDYTQGKAGLQRSVYNERAKNAFINNSSIGIVRWLGVGLNKLNNLNLRALSAEDTFFRRMGYTEYMQRALKAQGYAVTAFDGEHSVQIYDINHKRTLTAEESREIFDKISNAAVKQADESVFHDENRFANFLNKLRREKAWVKYPLDAVMPFTKTPFNIARRMVEFSPHGVASALFDYHKVQNGEITAQQYINNVSKGLVGDELALIGFAMAKAGFLRATGAGDDGDDKSKKFESEIGGVQDWALTFDGGKHYYSIGFAAPAVVPLLIGAQLEETFGGISSLKDVDWAEFGFDIVKAYYEPMLDASYMSGLINTYNTAKNYEEYGAQFTEDGKTYNNVDFIIGLGIGAFTNYVSQYFPSVGGKLVKTVYDEDFDTTSSSVFGTVGRTIAGKTLPVKLVADAISNELYGHPYLRPKVNLNGEEMTNTGGNVIGRAAYQNGSPRKLSTDRTHHVDRELARLYKATAAKNILPTKFYSIGDYSLNGEDKYQFNKKYLSKQKKEITEFVHSDVYAELTDKEKAKVISSIRTGLFHEAEQEYYTEHGYPIDPENPFVTDNDLARQTILGFNGRGTNFKAYQYYMIRNLENDKDANGNQIYNTSAMNARMIYEAAGIWGNVQEAVVSGKIKAGQAGLTNTVATWDDSTFTANYTKYQNGEYGTGSESKTDLEKEADRRATLEENKELADRTESVGVGLGTLLDARAAKSTKDEYGDAITYSQDLNARTTLTEDEIAKYQQAVKDGTMTILQATQDTGINAKVLMASSADYKTLAKALAEGTYDSKAATKILKKYAKWQKIATEQKKKAEGKADSSSGSASGSRSDSDDEAKATIKMLKNFVEAMADASESQAKKYKKQLQSSLNTLAKSDQDIYDEVMSADDLTKKLDLYGIKIKSQA